MKSGFKRAITLLGSLLLLALPLAAQTPTDTTVTTDTVLTDTTVTTETTWTETTLTETSTTEVYPTETESTTTYYEYDVDDDVTSDEDGAKVCAACAAFGIAIPLILLGISIAVALWIYRDAKSRGITSAPLWAILGFFFNILGLVIYLIARNGMTPPSSSAPGSTMAPPPPPPHV